MTGITRVGVVGTGTIGASWAAYFLAHGLDVVASDPAPGAESALRAAIAAHWPALTALGLAPGAGPERLRFAAGLEDALADVDFVQENAPEHVDFKIDLFRRMDAATPPEVVLASSSSSLLTSRMQSGCRHPERVVLGHPFNPPHLIPLVEVVGGDATAPATIARAMAFYAAIGKRPIRLRREVTGHVANRLQAAVWRECAHLLREGVVDAADIDTAITEGPGLRWALIGPLMTLHLSGGEGGIAHGIGHLGPAVGRMWEDLGSPAMDAAMQATIIDAVQAMVRDRPMDQVVAFRDRMLVDLLRGKAARPIGDDRGA